MPDGEVKIHIAVDGDTRAIDEVQKKIDQINRGKSQTASEANRRPAAPSSPSGTPKNTGDPLDQKLEKLKKLRAEQRAFEAQGATSSATSVRRQADKLEKTIDREGSRKLRVEEAETKRAQKSAADAAKHAKSAPLEKQRATIAQGLVEEGTARAAGNIAAADAIRDEVGIMQEALGLQKRHGISQKDAFTIARSNRQEESKVTQEIKEQSALRKAGIGTRGIQQAVGLGQDVMSGGNPASTASSMLLRGAAMTGNPALMAGAITASLATGIAGAMAGQGQWETMQGLQRNTRVANTKFNLDRQSGVFGSSSQLMGTALDAEAEVSARRNTRPELVEKARVKWQDPSTWKGLLGMKTDGQKELEESDAKSAEAQLRMAEARNKAKERYMQTEGGLELDVLRQRSKRTLEGSRKAFVDEEAGKAFAKYTDAAAKGATSDQAKEMATLTYQNDLRDRQANAGAGLVDSKSGGAGIAAAAQWAMRSTPQESEIKSEVGRLIGVVEKGNQTPLMDKHSK